MSVLLPWTDIVVPQGLSVRYWDGVSPEPSTVDDVGFYVLPYDKGDAAYRLLARLPALRVVQSLSAGVENLLPLVPETVTVANGQGLHDASVAEHATALVLAAQRDLPRWFEQQRARSWSREHTRSVADARVSVVGYGSIGKAVARALTALGAVVTPVARTASDGVRGIDELADVLPQSDIVVLVLPETPETCGIIGTPELAALPDGALVVNVGRGRTVDTDALVAETSIGRLRAALDVVDPEPLPADHPLWTVESVLITPHIAGGSDSFTPRAKTLIADQLRRYVAGEPLVNVVRS